LKKTDVHELRARLSAPDGDWPRRQWALFDVREPGESQMGHIPGATFLPRRMIEYRLPELMSSKSTPVILYDSGDDGDSRGARAAETMSELGFGDVTLLEGGAAAWKAAGFELATGWNVPSKDFGEQVLTTTDVPYLHSDEVAARLAAGENIGVFDVRTPDEYREASIPGSVCAPSFEWAMHLKDLAVKYDTIVVHCAGRTRSIIGAATAIALGLDQVRVLENGTMGWQLADRELALGQTHTLGEPSAESRELSRQRARILAEDAGAAFVPADTARAWFGTREQVSLNIFDTRDLKSYMSAHIPGAISLPGGQACQRADDFAAVPGARLLFVDDDDARAALSAYWFRRMGFPDVSVLDRGMPGWLEQGYPSEQGRGRPVPLGLNAAESATQAIDPATLTAALDSDAPPLLVDVGTSKHFSAGHILGAVWLPRGNVEDRIAALADTDTPIVIAARDPAQAAFAAASLVADGYSDVHRLALPASQWKEFFTLETGAPKSGEGVNDTLAIPYRQNKARMREYLEWEEKLGQKYKSTPQ